MTSSRKGKNLRAFFCSTGGLSAPSCTLEGARWDQPVRAGTASPPVVWGRRPLSIIERMPLRAGGDQEACRIENDSFSGGCCDRVFSEWARWDQPDRASAASPPVVHLVVHLVVHVALSPYLFGLQLLACRRRPRSQTRGNTRSKTGI